MKLISIISLCIIMQACGSGSGGSGGESGKPFNSIWVNKSDANDELDLTAVEFGALYTIVIEQSVNANCVCNVTAHGNSSSGTFNFGQCAYYGPGQSTCNMQYTQLTYVKTSDELLVCDANPTCSSYQ
jgi:hypothetical protein